MRIPPIYRKMKWRNTIPLDTESGRIGIGFDLADGEQLRISLDVESARHMIETVTDYLSRSHSPMSDGAKV